MRVYAYQLIDSHTVYEGVNDFVSFSTSLDQFGWDSAQKSSTWVSRNLLQWNTFVTYGRKWISLHTFFDFRPSLNTFVTGNICKMCWAIVSFVKICSDWCLFFLTLILLTWTIWRASTNASKWRMGFNSAFKGLMNLKEYVPLHLSGWRQILPASGMFFILLLLIVKFIQCWKL